VDYYALYSSAAPASFVKVLTEAYYTLSVNPLFSIQYSNIRALKLRIFPYSLYYVINEDKKVVRVLSCFHNKRNPNKRP
jgi:toxin ParE1/3/4